MTQDDFIAEFLDCARYDAMMEGPRFKWWNTAALNRLREKCEQEMARKRGAPAVWSVGLSEAAEAKDGL